MFGQDFDVKVCSKDFEFWNLIKICVRTCFFGKQNSTLGSVVPLAMFSLIGGIFVLRSCLRFLFRASGVPEPRERKRLF